jgi:hypothetical protein
VSTLWVGGCVLVRTVVGCACVGVGVRVRVCVCVCVLGGIFFYYCCHYCCDCYYCHCTTWVGEVGNRVGEAVVCHDITLKRTCRTKDKTKDERAKGK